MKEVKDIVREKAAEKFAAVFSDPHSICPDSLVVEQASSLPTAVLTASLVAPGSIVADLTAGLGVNTFCFASKCSKVYAIEVDEERAQALSTNLKIAGIDNVEVICDDCLSWLESTDAKLNLAYVDPMRRAVSGKKLVRIDDCRPEVSRIIPLLKNKANRLLIKASPLLDLTEASRQLPGVAGFYILEFKREVKELLIELDLSDNASDDKIVGYSSSSCLPFIKCVILNGDGQNECWEVSDADFPIYYLRGKEEIAKGGFIYEPSPAIMKAGKFGFVKSLDSDLKKLDINTHLFYSDRVLPHFPGRIFRVEGFLNSSQLKKMKGGRYNVISRNHPAKAPELESRYKFRPSGEAYIIAATIGKEKVIIEAVKQ